MLDKYIKLIAQVMVKRVLAEEVRMGGLKAVRAYIRGIGYLRIGIAGLVGLITCLALFVSGTVLAVSGLLGILGVSFETMSWIAFAVGILLTLAGVIILAIAFQEKRWLELSKSYELMDAVIEPVPSAKAVPQNMVNAFKGEPMEHVSPVAVQPRPTRAVGVHSTLSTPAQA